MTYQGQASIYFQDVARPTWPLPDSSVVAFSFIDATDSIQPLVIAASGIPADQDRPYKISISDKSTAVEGVHYKILNQPLRIKAQKTNDTVWIHWQRTADLLVHPVELELSLQPNDHFAVNMMDQLLNPTTGATKSYTRHRIITHDIIARPTNWMDGFTGPFSRKKFLLMVEVLGISNQYLMNLAPIAEWTAFAKLMQRYLNEQKSLGNIILDEDNTEMTMGPVGQ